MEVPRATADRILDAAETHFARRGLHGARVRDIAAACDLTAAALYRHFPGKEDLYAAVLTRGITPLVDLMRAFADAEDKRAEAPELVRAVMAHLAAHPNVPGLLYAEAIDGGERLEAMGATLRPLARQLLDELSDAALDPAALPFAAALFIHLSFSHTALAPLLSRVFGVDMLAPESLARHAALIDGVVGLVGTLAAGPGEAAHTR